MTDKIQILAELDAQTARKLKAKLALDGMTYKVWLSMRVNEYLTANQKADDADSRGDTK